jgi:hypothetical protein
MRSAGVSPPVAASPGAEVEFSLTSRRHDAIGIFRLGRLIVRQRDALLQLSIRRGEHLAGAAVFAIERRVVMGISPL